MSKGTITDKQREILEYIKSQILERGFPPAVREICEAVNLKSTSSVHSHLETLERNGYIHRDPTKPRAIEILDDEFNLLRREVVNVPLIGRVAAGEPLLGRSAVEVGLSGLVFGRSLCLLSLCSQAHGATLAGLSGGGLVPAAIRAGCPGPRCRTGPGDGCHS